jgi:hypothetical protein
MANRVRPYAEGNGYEYFKPTSRNPLRWLSNNKNWIYRIMRRGVHSGHG